MWEVLPFSFVVDWFLPIGPYLEALSTYQGLSFVRGYKTQFTKSETQFSHSYSGQHPGYSDKRVTLFSAGGLSWSQVKLNRTKLTSFPKPNLPSFKNPLSLTHAANGLALIQQVFGDKSETYIVPDRRRKR